MRYILVFILIFLSLFAEEKKQTITLGMGPYIQTQPYAGVGSVLVPSPVIFFDNSLFYIRWTRVGLYFLGEENDDFSWGFSLTAQPRIYGYESSDIIGMDKRETSFEGGLAFSAKMGKAHIELMALTDILDRYDTWVYNAEIAYDLEVGNFSIYPSILASYQSSKFTDYYYGITQVEATRRGENKYVPSSGLQVGIQTYIEYPFTKKFSALINIRADKISNQASNSPLTNDDYIYSGLASLIYTFEY